MKTVISSTAVVLVWAALASAAPQSSVPDFSQIAACEEPCQSVLDATTDCGISSTGIPDQDAISCLCGNSDFMNSMESCMKCVVDETGGGSDLIEQTIEGWDMICGSSTGSPGGDETETDPDTDTETDPDVTDPSEPTEPTDDTTTDDTTGDEDTTTDDTTTDDAAEDEEPTDDSTSGDDSTSSEDDSTDSGSDSTSDSDDKETTTDADDDAPVEESEGAASMTSVAGKLIALVGCVMVTGVFA